MTVPIIIEEAPEIIPAIEVLEEGGTVIRVQFGEAFPGQGLPVFIDPDTATNPNALRTWGNIYDYIVAPFQEQTAPATLNMPAVIEAFQRPLERQLQVTASYANLLADFLQTFAQTENAKRLNLGETMTNLVEDIWATAERHADQLRAIEHLAIPNLQAQILANQKAAYQLALNAWTLANQWGLENIFKPLHEDINQLEGRTNRVIDAKTGKVLDTARGLVNGEAILRASEVGVVAAAVAKLTKWVDECGEPMCQQLGPKTDTSKWLKKLAEGGILALLAGFALADPSAVAQAAVTFAQVSGPAIENTVGDWLQDLHDITS